MSIKEETSLSKHNYSQYSNKKNVEGGVSAKVAKTPLVPADLVSTPVDDEVIHVIATPEIKMEVTNVEPVIETVDTATLPKTVKGIVTNCARLNVRAYPSIDADVVCVLDVMSELEINTEKSTYDWLCVCTATGVDGYCMKKFVDADL